MLTVATLLLFQLIFIDIQAIQVGFIQNASLIPSDTSSSFVYGSCDACLCAMLNSNQTIVSFNCYKNNGTCRLFTDYLLTVLYQLTDKSDSIFYFLQLPPTLITSLFWAFDGSINEALIVSMLHQIVISHLFLRVFMVVVQLFILMVHSISTHRRLISILHQTVLLLKCGFILNL
jgi:hypothetical protein